MQILKWYISMNKNQYIEDWQLTTQPYGILDNQYGAIASSKIYQILHENNIEV